MLTDSPATQYYYQRKWALNGEAQKMKAVWWSVSEPASSAVAWILLANMGSEVPKQAAFIIHICLKEAFLF